MSGDSCRNSERERAATTYMPMANNPFKHKNTKAASKKAGKEVANVQNYHVNVSIFPSIRLDVYRWFWPAISTILGSTLFVSSPFSV